jgi:histidinol-phosphate/aromatic aminotransferase/cobyric acid decarboxylase-like protein
MSAGGNAAPEDRGSPTTPTIPPPGPHGGDAVAIARALGLDARTMIDLSISMNPLAPDAGRLLADELRAGSAALHHYPDPAAATNALAAAIGVAPELLIVTNGGAEAIALVAAEVRTGSIVEPEFSLYRRHLTLDPSAPRWRSNPVNPLGELAPADARAGVWDEAFYPLATGTWTRGDADAWRLGSLTKTWNCAGLRIGYVIAPNDVAAARIRVRQPEWAVNSAALALVPLLLERTDLQAWAHSIAMQRSRLAAALRALGFEVQETSANWVLVDRPRLRAALAAQRVVVRDCASYGLPGVHRVAVPHPDELDAVIAAFARVAGG